MIPLKHSKVVQKCKRVARTLFYTPYVAVHEATIRSREQPQSRGFIALVGRHGASRTHHPTADAFPEVPIDTCQPHPTDTDSIHTDTSSWIYLSKIADDFMTLALYKI